MPDKDRNIDVADNSVPAPDGNLGVTAQISVLAADVSALASAELDYYKNRLYYSQSVLKRAGFYALVAIAMFFSAVAALVFGMLLILNHFAGPVVATVAVTLGFLALAAAAGLMARKSASNLSFPREKDAQDD